MVQLQIATTFLIGYVFKDIWAILMKENRHFNVNWNFELRTFVNRAQMSLKTHSDECFDTNFAFRWLISFVNRALKTHSWNYNHQIS